MGYHTEFKGALAFTSEPDVVQLRALNEILGEDRREHPEWEASDEFYYLDLALTEDLRGLKWSGAEKSYGMVAQVNFVVSHMRKQWPEFGLTGSVEAQGEDPEDAWTLTMEDGVAVKRERELPGFIVQCPRCHARFRYTKETT